MAGIKNEDPPVKENLSEQDLEGISGGEDFVLGHLYNNEKLLPVVPTGATEASQPSQTLGGGAGANRFEVGSCGFGLWIPSVPIDRSLNAVFQL